MLLAGLGAYSLGASNGGDRSNSAPPARSGRRCRNTGRAIDAVAIEAAKEMGNAIRRVDSTEWGGWIYNDDGRLSYSEPFSSNAGGHVDIAADPNFHDRNGVPYYRHSRVVGWYHSHPDRSPVFVGENEGFSTSDMNLSRRYRIPGYLRTPTGRVLRFNPTGGTVFDISKCGIIENPTNDAYGSWLQGQLAPQGACSWWPYMGDPPWLWWCVVPDDPRGPIYQTRPCEYSSIQGGRLTCDPRLRDRWPSSLPNGGTFPENGSI